jgi:hypothetical protein
MEEERMKGNITKTCKQILLVFIAPIIVFACIINTSGLNTNDSNNPNNNSLSEKDYKAACKEIAVSDLTKTADSIKSKLIKITGKVVSFEETTGNDNSKITKLIIGVDDPAHTLPSGVLPVYIVLQGTTDSFINDTITAYGEVYGNDSYKSPQIKEKTLPRIDAKYIEKK